MPLAPRTQVASGRRLNTGNFLRVLQRQPPSAACSALRQGSAFPVGRRAAEVGAAALLISCMAKGSLQKAHAKASALLERKQAQQSPNGVRNDNTAAPVPRIIAFDLDGTLWWPEMYMLSGPPFTPVDREGRLVKDGRGETVRLMGASHDILREIVTSERFQETEIAMVSRCDYPPWAVACMRLFEAAPGVTLADATTYTEIYYGSKTKHFRQVHKASGVPYREMLFFDNEMRNIRDVAALGVTCVYTPEGMTAQNWQEGLLAYQHCGQCNRNLA